MLNFHKNQLNATKLHPLFAREQGLPLGMPPTAPSTQKEVRVRHIDCNNISNGQREAPPSESTIYAGNVSLESILRSATNTMNTTKKNRTSSCEGDTAERKRSGGRRRSFSSLHVNGGTSSHLETILESKLAAQDAANTRSQLRALRKELGRSVAEKVGAENKLRHLQHRGVPSAQTGNTSASLVLTEHESQRGVLLRSLDTANRTVRALEVDVKALRMVRNSSQATLQAMSRQDNKVEEDTTATPSGSSKEPAAASSSPDLLTVEELEDLGNKLALDAAQLQTSLKEIREELRLWVDRNREQEEIQDTAAKTLQSQQSEVECMKEELECLMQQPYLGASGWTSDGIVSALQTHVSLLRRVQERKKEGSQPREKLNLK